MASRDFLEEGPFQLEKLENWPFQLAQAWKGQGKKQIEFWVFNLGSSEDMNLNAGSSSPCPLAL